MSTAVLQSAYLTRPTPVRIPAPDTITQEHLDRCHPIWDHRSNAWFYQVESESDLTTEYEVRYDPKTGSFTCTCPAGQEGFIHCHKHQYCKHVRWSCAHYAQSLQADSWLNELNGKMMFRDWM